MATKGSRLAGKGMRTIQCQLCDKKIEVNSVNKYCPDCRKEKKKEWGKKTAAKGADRIKAYAKKYNKEKYHEKFPDARYYSK